MSQIGNYVVENDQHQALAEAVNTDDIRMINQLISAGADANIRDEFGYTPLMIAAMFGNCRTVETLLISGADMNCATIVGRTALQLAAQYCHHDSTRLLLDKGACLPDLRWIFEKIIYDDIGAEPHAQSAIMLLSAMHIPASDLLAKINPAKSRVAAMVVARLEADMLPKIAGRETHLQRVNV